MRKRQQVIIDYIGSAVMLYLIGLLAVLWFIGAALGAGVHKLLRWRP